MRGGLAFLAFLTSLTTKCWGVLTRNQRFSGLCLQGAMFRPPSVEQGSQTIPIIANKVLTRGSPLSLEEDLTIVVYIVFLEVPVV